MERMSASVPVGPAPNDAPLAGDAPPEVERPLEIAGLPEAALPLEAKPPLEVDVPLEVDAPPEVERPPAVAPPPEFDPTPEPLPDEAPPTGEGALTSFVEQANSAKANAQPPARSSLRVLMADTSPRAYLRPLSLPRLLRASGRLFSCSYLFFAHVYVRVTATPLLHRAKRKDPGRQWASPQLKVRPGIVVRGRPLRHGRRPPARSHQKRLGLRSPVQNGRKVAVIQ